MSIIHYRDQQCDELREEWVPVRILRSHNVTGLEELTSQKAASVSFQVNHCAHWQGAGSWVLMDFGRELCGGVRIITHGGGEAQVRWRLTFGESVTEACSSIGVKNATNDHSPRDLEIVTSFMSDLTFGQTGFRFARLELLSEAEVLIQNVFAVSLLPKFEREAAIVTSDPLVNQIIQTAAYTLKLNLQNGYVWDGIKRDRLVWCGDLHPELLSSLYMFGDTSNLRNSLTFLREETPADQWVNNIPSYSAWWVINLCDYCAITGNRDYYAENRDYALKVLEHIDTCLGDDGTMNFTDGGGMAFFLDWSTHEKPDAPIGVASLLRLAAQKFLGMEENAVCRGIIRKLAPYVEKDSVLKPVRAFQILGGRQATAADAATLQKDGARGLSTFMAYYILTAAAKAGGTDMLEMLKTYYGGMLSRGATSFWEDFDIDWLEGSGRIDEFPEEGQKDIHGDFGKYCYTQFRHSLCHGWSSGVLAFIVEYLAGIHIADGGRAVTVNPHPLGLTDIDAVIPMENGELRVAIHGGKVDVSAPAGITIIR